MALIAVAVLGLFGALALLAGGIVFYWQTNNGIVRIEINDPDIKVAFDKNGPIITGADKQDIKLTPGEFGLSVERGDLKFDTEKFILKRGETITLKIEWFKEGKLQVVHAGKGVIGEKALAPTSIAPVAAGHYALRFSGQDHVVVLPEALTVDAAGDFTLEGFVNLSGNHALLVGTPAIAVQTFTQPWRFQVYAAEDKPVVVNDTKGPASQYGNRRVHVAGVRAGGKLRLFVDGRLVGSGALDGKLFTRANQVLRIGPADGVIGEVRISKVARYDKDFTPQKRFEPDKDTLALYHFDEGSGDVLKDSSGNGHHGKIVGAKWVKADGSPIGPRTDYALQFDRDAQVNLKDLKLDPTSGPLTMEAYVALSAEHEKLRRSILWTANGTGLYVDPHWTFSARGGGRPTISSADAAAIGKRTHIAGVVAAKEILFFVDGKLVGRKDYNAKAESAFTSLLIGGKTSNFVGTLSEVRISKVARYDQDFTPAQRFEPDADTLALYHFDEGSGDVLKDSSGNGHHGKIVGAKWVNADGSPIGPPAPAVGDHALSFEGKGATVTLPLSLKLDSSKPFTLEAYVTPKALGESVSPELILGSYDHTHLQVGNIWRFIASLDTKSLRADSKQAPVLGQKSHVAGVFTGTQLRLFIDGKLVQSVDTKGPMAGENQSPFYIHQKTSALNVIIDEVRISKVARYDKDFTPAQRFAPDADTLALYHCDEGSGDVLKDSSGNGHDGKIVGAKWVNADGTAVGSVPPLDPAWLKAVAAMKADEQVKAVADELKKRNPDFDGKMGRVPGAGMRVYFDPAQIRDISPLQALPELEGKLVLTDSKVSDLTPLKGMKLATLYCDRTPVEDLSPLQGMKLAHLYCGATKVKDLSPLKDMPLWYLDIWGTKVTDLAPLKGMKLNGLAINNTQVSDLSPLTGMRLTHLIMHKTRVTDLSPLKGLPLTFISCDYRPERDAEILRSIKTLETINGKPATEFWKEVDKK